MSSSRNRFTICCWCSRWPWCWCSRCCCSNFGTFAAPTAILASALLSTSGVFFALLITGTTFNISSFMGLIMVIGIVAKNGILLLDADQRFRAEGTPPREAMLQAGARRLRPIIMTALATIAGMIPLVARDRRGLADAAASGDRRNRWNPRVDGALADRDPGGELLFERARLRVSVVHRRR